MKSTDVLPVQLSADPLTRLLKINSPAAITSNFMEGIKANHAKKYAMSLRLLLKAYPYFESNSNPANQAYCAYYIGLNFKAIDEYEQALPYLKIANQLASDSKSMLELQQVAQLYLGICQEALGDYPAAMKTLSEIANKSTYDTPEKTIFYFRGKLHFYRCMIMQGDYTLAKENLTALETATDLHFACFPGKAHVNTELQALLYQLQGICAVLSNAFKTALEKFEKANSIYRTLKGSQKHIATIEQYLGVTYTNLGATSKSIFFLIKAKSYFETIANTSSLYFIYLALAVNYILQKNHQRAHQNLQKAIELASKNSTGSNLVGNELYTTTQYFLPQLKTESSFPEVLELEAITLKIAIYNKLIAQNNSTSKSHQQSGPFTFIGSQNTNSAPDVEEIATDGEEKTTAIKQSPLPSQRL